MNRSRMSPKLTRRQTLGMLGASAALPLALGRATRAAAQTPPVRSSLPSFAQDPARLASLMRGVAAMKARPPSEPTSWFFQAAVHGVTEEAVQQALAADPAVAQVDQARFWNQCPHFGQTSANFLIWHRAYLHYFERILREAAGDPDLAIPYWDYTASGQRRFPAVFAPEFLDQAQQQPNPLHHPERDLAFVSGVLELNPRAVDVQSAFDEVRFFGPTDEEGFAGGNADTESGTQGLIENIPHNMVHFAVGGAIGSVSGAMGGVTMAAFDPVFWVHHAMIDRLWTDWMCRPGREWGSLPDAAWFDERPWAFHDADGSVREETRRSYMDHRALGYRYDTEDPGCTPLELPEAPVVVAADGEVGTPAPARVLAEARAEVTIAADPVALPLGEALAELALDDTPAPARILVEVEGVRPEGTPLMGYDVFVTDDLAAASDRSAPGYVGTLALFGLDHRTGGHGAVGPQVFDATEALRALGDPSRAAVVIQPFDLLVPAANPTEGVDPRLAEARMANLGAVSISGIRLVQQ